MTLPSLTRRCLSGLLTLTALQGGVGVAGERDVARAEQWLEESLKVAKSTGPQGRWTLPLVNCLKQLKTKSDWESWNRQCGNLVEGIEVERALYNFAALTNLTIAETNKLLDSLVFPNANTTSRDVVEMEIEFRSERRTIEITLDREKAPLLVEHFLNHVQDGIYDGTRFESLYKGDSLLGGYYDVNWDWKENRKQIIGKWEEMRVERGTIAFMSHLGRIDSSIFFNLGDRICNGPVFGRVTAGLEFLDDIGRAVANARPVDFNFLSANPVIIRKATFVRCELAVLWVTN